MASISFAAKPPTQQSTPAPEPVSVPEVSYPSDNKETSLAVAPAKQMVIAPTMALSTEIRPVLAPGISGEVSVRDIKLPRLNLVQKVGGLSEIFQPGSIVFQKTLVLSDGKSEHALDVTPLKLDKKYQRKTEWGEGSRDEQPETYATAAEVRLAGGSLEYGDENYFQEVADITFAVQIPETVEIPDELEDLIGYTFADSRYTVAMWTVASSSYTALGKRIISDSAMVLRNGIFTGHYKLSSEMRKNAKNSWFVPRPVFAGKHTQEAAEFFFSLALQHQASIAAA